MRLSPTGHSPEFCDLTLLHKVMRTCAGIVVALALCGTSAAFAADAFPSRPVKIICVYPAGGGIDIVMRAVAQKLSMDWGSPVVVENIAGAGTTVGTAAVAKAAPDGYTLLATDTSFSIAASFYDTLPYDPAKSLAPISMFAIASHGLVVNASFPAHSVKELVAYAKANPGKTLFATPGPGTIDHLGWALLNKETNDSIVVVPYKGSGGALVDIVAGRVQAYSGATGTLVSYVKSGQLRALATFESDRTKVMPDVPTIAEAGFPDLTMNAWYGLFAPAGTPRDVIEKINDGLAKSLATKEVQDTLALLGNVPVLGIGPEKFTAFLKSDIEKWRKAVLIAGKN